MESSPDILRRIWSYENSFGTEAARGPSQVFAALAIVQCRFTDPDNSTAKIYAVPPFLNFIGRTQPVSCLSRNRIMSLYTTARS